MIELSLSACGRCQQCIQLMFLAGTFPEIAYSDIDTVIGQDESGVRGGELGGRHYDCIEVSRRECGDIESFAKLRLAVQKLQA